MGLREKPLANREKGPQASNLLGPTELNPTNNRKWALLQMSLQMEYSPAHTVRTAWELTQKQRAG